jgi:hypothetical protein
MVSALVGFGVGQHTPPESLSKRAPSTTRTSLRLYNQPFAGVWSLIIAHAGGFQLSSSITFRFSGLESMPMKCVEEIVSDLAISRRYLRAYEARTFS